MLLLVADAYSRWLEVVPLPAATSTLTINSLRAIFATHDLTKELVTDNGPQFSRAEFEELMRNS